MTTFVCKSPNEIAGGKGSNATNRPLKYSGVSNTLSSTILILKHCIGEDGVSENVVKKVP